MTPFMRFLQRLAILALGALTIWFVVFVVFEEADQRMPLVLAVAATYVIAAYIIFPRIVRFGYKLLKRQHVPRYTVTGDGLPGDPVNLVLVGTHEQLRQAFAAAGWFGADPLSLASSWRMTWTFIRNIPYGACWVPGPSNGTSPSSWWVEMAKWWSGSPPLWPLLRLRRRSCPCSGLGEPGSVHYE